MSKIGKQPIKISEGVEVKLDESRIEVRGKLGTIILPILNFISAKIVDGQLQFASRGNSLQSKANWGTMRALANNAVWGVTKGYEKILELEGVGFKASLEGKTLVLSVGFSHLVRFEPPADVALAMEKGAIKISGINKATVGKVAAEIRALKKPEPYKGSGIHYRGEIIRRKAGKKVAGAGASSSGAAA